ncbi:MAG: hypothetical protein AAFU79_07285 [Myxococcota bacterium]
MAPERRRRAGASSVTVERLFMELLSRGGARRENLYSLYAAYGLT